MKYRSEFKHGFTNPEEFARRCSVKKVLLKISQNSQESNTLAQVLSFEFCDISQDTFFIEHLRWLLLLIVTICSVAF